MSALSSTFEAHQAVHSEERHFALVEGFAFALPTKARLVICFRSGTQSDPCISSVTRSIMITTSNSPVKRSGIPNQLLDVLLHTIAISGLSRVRTELSQLCVIPFLPHHPIEANRELSRHRHLGDLPASPQRHVTVLTPPLRIAAYRDLRRFHQQETQQRVSLFRDVSQAPPLPARILQRNQSQISRDLLATLEPISSPDDQNKRQRRQRAHPGMRLQALRLRTLLHFLFDGCGQLGYRRSQSVEQLQQIAPSPARPRS